MLSAVASCSVQEKKLEFSHDFLWKQNERRAQAILGGNAVNSWCDSHTASHAFFLNSPVYFQEMLRPWGTTRPWMELGRGWCWSRWVVVNQHMLINFLKKTRAVSLWSKKSRISHIGSSCRHISSRLTASFTLSHENDSCRWCTARLVETPLWFWGLLLTILHSAHHVFSAWVVRLELV